jgi:lipopolysaccharide transport system permease protein
MDELLIEAGKIEKQYWRDVWKYRELFGFIVWRDLLVRYKQTVVGVAWSAIRPLAMILVLTFATTVGGLPTGGVPHALFILSAMLPWQLFSSAVSESGMSLVTNSNLISKVYFPRIVVPAGSVITSAVDFLVSLALFGGLCAWYRHVPPPQIALLPIFVLAACMASLGGGLLIAALMVRYRDVRFILPFIVQFGLYASPVLIMTNRIPDQWRLLYFLNPMAGIIDGFRWSLLGREHQLYWPGVTISLLATSFLLGWGLTYFRRTERSFADVI